MSTEQLVATYSPIGDMISVILCWILLYIIVKVLYFSKDRKFEYLKRALHFILTGSICNIAFYVSIIKYTVPVTLLFLFRMGYHLSFLLCLYCFLAYMKNMLDVKGRFVNTTVHLTRTLFVICMVMELFTQSTKLGLCYEDGKWNDSIFSAYNFFYVYAAVTFLIMLLFFSERLIRSVRICLILTEIIIAVIMFYQGVININTFSSFTYLLPIVVVLILIHSKPFDDKTGSLGANSFESFARQSIEKGVSVDYIALKLQVTMIDRLPDELGKVLNSFWHDSFKDALLFEMSSDLYVLAIPRLSKNGDTETKMHELVKSRFPGYYEQYKLSYKIIELYDVDYVENDTDILGIMKYLLQGMDENTELVVDAATKEELRKFKIIKDSLADIEAKGDLNDPRVLVYCQPIRNMRTGRFDTGEALMRLQLPEIGMVMPYMFIDLAEQYDNIHALTKVMLNKACSELKKLDDEGYSYERVSINFVASEVKVDGFCKEIIDIIKAHGIEPSRIGIELTESQTESDFKIIKQKMQILHDAGMTLYLDDIGTGYSNLDRIVQYDVDVVKFDRFFLLEAEKSAKVVKMMSHLSAAFRDLDYKLLFEGVETDEHEALCVNCGADYIQGYKYSKPVPIETMRDFFVKSGRAEK